MFVCGWSVLGLRFGLLVLSFYPVQSFVPRVESVSPFSCGVVVKGGYSSRKILAAELCLNSTK